MALIRTNGSVTSNPEANLYPISVASGTLGYFHITGDNLKYIYVAAGSAGAPLTEGTLNLGTSALSAVINKGSTKFGTSPNNIDLTSFTSSEAVIQLVGGSLNQIQAYVVGDNVQIAWSAT